ncbi:hypothetical protein ABPG74_017124 [Tetrahymena malaccensis]
MKRYFFLFVIFAELQITSISSKSIEISEIETLEENFIREVGDISQDNCKKCLTQSQLDQMQRFYNSSAKKQSSYYSYDFSNNVFLDSFLDSTFDIGFNSFFNSAQINLDDFSFQFYLPIFNEAKVGNQDTLSISFMQTQEIIPNKIDNLNVVNPQQEIQTSQSQSYSSNSDSSDTSNIDESIIIIFILVGIFLIPYPFLCVMRILNQDFGYNLENMFLFSALTSFIVTESSIQLYKKYKNNWFLLLNLYTIGTLTVSTSLCLGLSEYGLKMILFSTLYTFLVLFYYLLRTDQLNK